jgi:hypothetical protein
MPHQPDRAIATDIVLEKVWKWHGHVLQQVAAEMRALTDSKARAESLVEQLGTQVEEAQVMDCCEL